VAIKTRARRLPRLSYLEARKMARTTRKNLILSAEQALACIDRLDLYLMNMSEMSAGRQPAITNLESTLIEGHEAVRRLWLALHDQL
jgi:hypothetical protein